MSKTEHSGRFAQMLIYIGKHFRMFIFQNDWKVLPMAAIITGLVSIVVAKNLNMTQEGTRIGTFALSCVCIWNGCFNSIQSVCRERNIVKREHRSGLHITSYVAAHLVYQAFLCLLQTIITVVVLYMFKVKLPSKGLVSGYATFDMIITVFMITYSADAVALFISSVVRSTTTAMTVMPFMLIFQMIFSGGFFELSESMQPLSNLTISKWGLISLDSLGGYNDLPSVSMFNMMLQVYNSDAGEDTASEFGLEAEESKDFIKDGKKKFLETFYVCEWDDNGDLVKYEARQDRIDAFQLRCGKLAQKEEYTSTRENVYGSWNAMWIIIAISAIASVISLEFIDRDKR